MATLRSSSIGPRSTARVASSFVALVMIVGAVFCLPACGSSDGVNVAQFCPTTPMRITTSPSISATQFCQLYLQTCKGASNPPEGYLSLAECTSVYAGLTFETTRQCRSYHLCNAASYDVADALFHCRHTVGLDMCADTAIGP